MFITLTASKNLFDAKCQLKKYLGRLVLPPTLLILFYKTVKLLIVTYNHPEYHNNHPEYLIQKQINHPEYHNQ